MKKRVLGINELHVSDKPIIYTCYGLGSCIGLFLTDRLAKLSGAAHIPIPDEQAGDLMSAPIMIDSLLNSLRVSGSDLACLRAKLTGGSRIYDRCSYDIGQRNAHEVLQLLIGRKIFIAASDLGGAISRTARFNSLSGVLQITTSEQKMYCI